MGKPTAGLTSCGEHNCYPNTHYGFEAHIMYNHILLPQYGQNYYTYNNVVKNTYSQCHRDACVKILRGIKEHLLRFKGVSQTCFSIEHECVFTNSIV